MSLLIFIDSLFFVIIIQILQIININIHENIYIDIFITKNIIYLKYK